MSSSDDDDFDQLFDAFDQVDEENVMTASIAGENILEHGTKFDPYEYKMTPEEADQAKIKTLKSRHKRQADEDIPPRPTKRRVNTFSINKNASLYRLFKIF